MSALISQYQNSKPSVINMSKKISIIGGRGFTGQELIKLIESHPEKAQLLKSLLAEFNSEQADPVVPSAFEVPILIDKYDGQKYEEGDDYIYWSN